MFEVVVLRTGDCGVLDLSRSVGEDGERGNGECGIALEVGGVCG